MTAEITHPRLPQAISLLEELVAFDTISSRSNRAMVEHIQMRLEGMQIASAIKYTDDGEKANLLANIGPTTEGGVVLSGHTDVVDVAGQDWHSPPFALRQQDGCLYGRGSCDMKGFIACTLAMAPVFAGSNLRRPVQLAFSRDEEIGCLGSADMLSLIKDSGIRPQVAIIGEPTCMKTIAGHKGGLVACTTFGGVPAHSSLPHEGISAIPYAARFVGYLGELEAAMAKRAPAGSPFSPAYGTINVGMIEGGTALNIFAARCEVRWHYRSLPDENLPDFAAGVDDFLQSHLLPDMRAGGQPAQVDHRVEASYPGLVPMDTSPALALVSELTGDSDVGVLSIGTEAGYFQQGGIASVVIGPGDLAQAHKPNEYVRIEQLAQCLHFLDKLCVRLSN